MKSRPHTTEHHAACGVSRQEIEKGLNQSRPRWVDLACGGGCIRIGVEFVESDGQYPTIDNFEPIGVLDEEALTSCWKCGEVICMRWPSITNNAAFRKHDTWQVFVLKTVHRAEISTTFDLTDTLAGQSLLSRINHPFIMPLKQAFLSSAKLHLAMSYVGGEELFHHLQRVQRFEDDRAKFYTAELLSALEYLHEHDVIHGDLKPENIILDYSGHITLCDFDLCKIEMAEENPTDCKSNRHLQLFGLG
jgi:serum/glucocorticoid-regulated kinase 2